MVFGALSRPLGSYKCCLWLESIWICCCFLHNPGASEWAQKTLKDHAKDPREYVYTREELEKAKTHDKLWNAAQVIH